MKETQLKIVKDQLLKYGEVSRNWCFRLRPKAIARLASRINDLKREGWVFTTEKREGDFVYKAAYIPKQEKLVREVDIAIEDLKRRMERPLNLPAQLSLI